MITNHLAETVELTYADYDAPTVFHNVTLAADVRPVGTDALLAMNLKPSEQVTYNLIFVLDRGSLPDTTVVKWRGDEYLMLGPTMLQTRRGQRHHHTATIFRRTPVPTPPP